MLAVKTLPASHTLKRAQRVGEAEDRAVGSHDHASGQHCIALKPELLTSPCLEHSPLPNVCSINPQA